MIRKLIDFKKLDVSLIQQLAETYPNGYGDDDIITFRNAQGEIIEAVELQTDTTLYLIKLSKHLSHFIANLEEVEKELHYEEEEMTFEMDEDFTANNME
jgi:hypothetical protein